MTMLVHLVDSKSAKSVARSGIRGQARILLGPGGKAGNTVTLDNAVFAMPVLPNFYASHQWLRELKRRGMRSISAVYFRMRSDAMVWVGRYNSEHRHVPFGHAGGMIMREADPRGWEIVLPRSVAAKEVHECREVPQVVGWRYFPESHEKGPWKCVCEYCLAGTRGEIKSRKFRERLVAAAKREGRED